MLNAIRQFVKEEEGASAAEYAVLLAIIGATLIAAVPALSNAIAGAFGKAETAINGISIGS